MALNRALVGLCVGVAGLGACTSVRRIQPVEYLADNAPEVVWVTDTSNTVVPVADAEIKRDTLRGMWQGASVKIPLGGIRSVDAKIKDGKKTALLVTTVGVAVVSTFYVMLVSQGESGGNVINCGVDHNGDVIQDC